MKWFSAILAGGLLALSGFLLFDYIRPGALILADIKSAGGRNQKTLAERVREAGERSQGVKAVYMTSAVANDRGVAATRLRDSVINLLETTELNGVVIDIKETEGGAIITDQLRALIQTLHEKGIWVIAREVVFKDSSQEKAHPSWYLKRKNGAVWRDRRGGSWLDPASREAWQYQAGIAKAAIDAGFDEIQFDYIRFPSDGDVRNIVYPVYDAKQPKYEVMREFFGYLHDELKRYKPEIILSADLFGYVALQQADLGIGQRLEDIGKNFDYISLMVYPSHYYSGFQVAADPGRELPALYYPYQSANASQAASNHPYEVIHRSLLVAGDALRGTASGTAPVSANVAAASSPIAPLPAQEPPRETARLRPWLQDFDLAVDSNRGIHYDAKKVRAEIDAAEAAGSSGWLLWSANNVYTAAALKPETNR